MSLRIVMIGLIMIAAAALGVMALQLRAPAPPKQAAATAAAPPALVSYLVTARSLPAGTLVRSEDFNGKSVPADQVPPDVILDTAAIRSDLRGGLVRRFLEAGMAPKPADLIRPRDRGFLSAVLAPGTRAVSIGVDAVSGVSGLIWPGDRVDVILTQEFPGPNGEAHRLVTSETVLTDVRIIAVDQDIAQGAPNGGGAGKLATTVTLEVNNDQAEKIAVSGRLGKLSLAVRSAADNGTIANTAGVTGADVSQAYARANGVAPSRIQVIEGEHRSEVQFK